MPDSRFFADGPEQVGLDPEKVDALLARAARDVESGLLPGAQLALARHGKIAVLESFGRAVQGGEERAVTADTHFVAMSSTKAITSAAAWLLLQEGMLRLEDRIADYVPEYATKGKDATTLEQLLIHTSGIPFAPHYQKEWADPARRAKRFADWRLDHPPGEAFRYHLSANFWPVAAAIEQRSGMTLAEFVRTRIAEPLGIPELRLGLPEDGEKRVADGVWVGEALTAEDYEKLGVVGNPVIAAIDESGLLELNERVTREAGSPSAGCITTAGDFALFYQALLAGGRAHDGTVVWTPEILEEARKIRTGDLRDPVLGSRANRGLGIVIAGDDGQANMRGFGRTNSPQSFGHPGAGGQCNWGDPATGISFSFLTHGYDRNEIRTGRRQVALSSLAAACAA